MPLEKLAIRYVAEGYSIKGARLMGRQSAGAAFLRAVANEAPRSLFCYSRHKAEAQHLGAELARLGAPGTAVEWIPFEAHRRLPEAGVLYNPDPNMITETWLRARTNPRAYSICGVAHTISTHRAMGNLADLQLTPLEEWDALICTSDAVHDSVMQLVEAQRDFLARKLGATRFPLPRLPVIPLGVHCQDYRRDPGERDRARRDLAVEPGAIVALFVGRLSFHAKAHHAPMYMALAEAAAGRKVTLIQAGWFANSAIEDLFKREAMELCPNVQCLFVDGRKPDQLRKAWAAADLFTSLTDNFQETFGLTPIEAMASGLPCVVSDWNGYKGTVRDGIDGFRIPTLTLPPGSAASLSDSHNVGVYDYDKYAALTSQLVAVDVGATREAYVRLFDDAALRARMGEEGRKRAAGEFDWSVVMTRYRELWAELEERRNSGADGVAAPVRPERMNPFSMFRSYPTSIITAKTVFTLRPGASRAEVGKRLGLGSARYASNILMRTENVNAVMSLFEQQPEQSFADILRQLPSTPPQVIMRVVTILSKFGLLSFTAERSSERTSGRTRRGLT